MDGEESDSMESEIDDSPEFTLAEILVMDSLFKELGEESTSTDFCKQLAAKFSTSTYRLGKPSMSWEAVQSWFEDKQETLAAKVFQSSGDQGATHSKTAATRHRDKVQTISARKAAELLPNLIFEARSAKDYAWFDVAAFLNYRVLYSGELVVRVRFAGFGKEEDEWVNIKSALRERSIPLKHSECNRVNVGDLVLCYKENDDHALYCDAHVLEIERKLHDGDVCSCSFLVRYDYTDIEEKVPLGKLCCRPAKANSASIGNQDENTLLHNSVG